MSVLRSFVFLELEYLCALSRHSAEDRGLQPGRLFVVSSNGELEVANDVLGNQADNSSTPSPAHEACA